VRAYLGAHGGWQGVAALGSVACVGRDGLGGHKGRGCHWPRVTAWSRHPRCLRCPLERRCLWLTGSITDLPQSCPSFPVARLGNFDGGSLHQAFNSHWQVDTRADRMGIRLTGPALVCRHPGMVSEGLAAGAIQVPPDGQPICLMNDRQTIGGYPGWER